MNQIFSGGAELARALDSARAQRVYVEAYNAARINFLERSVFPQEDLVKMTKQQMQGFKYKINQKTQHSKGVSNLKSCKPVGYSDLPGAGSTSIEPKPFAMMGVVGFCITECRSSTLDDFYRLPSEFGAKDGGELYRQAYDVFSTQFDNLVQIMYHGMPERNIYGLAYNPNLEANISQSLVKKADGSAAIDLASYDANVNQSAYANASLESIVDELIDLSQYMQSPRYIISRDAWRKSMLKDIDCNGCSQETRANKLFRILNDNDSGLRINTLSTPPLTEMNDAGMHEYYQLQDDGLTVRDTSNQNIIVAYDSDATRLTYSDIHSVDAYAPSDEVAHKKMGIYTMGAIIDRVDAYKVRWGI